MIIPYDYIQFKWKKNTFTFLYSVRNNIYYKYYYNIYKLFTKAISISM